MKTLAFIVILIILIILGCAQSKKTFDPTQKQNIAEEVSKQATAVEIKSGMDCREKYKLKLKYCTTKRDCFRARRDLSRVRGATKCSLAWNKNDLEAIRRQIDKGR